MNDLELIYSLLGIGLLIYYSATLLFNAHCSLHHALSKKSSVDVNPPSFTEVSIIISVRNEASNIGCCIESILGNTYPSTHYEIIVVNDHSTDDTAQIVKEYSKVRYILNKGVGKKQALTQAIDIAEHDVILSTDGDTTVGPKWIEIHARSAQNHDFSTGIIKYQADNSTLGLLQIHDNAATMCLTLYGILNNKWHVANGANMSFSKALYTSAGGHTHNAHIPSGDDVFLIRRARELKASIGFIDDLDAAVTTNAELTWSSFWQQRRRWSSKTMIVKDTKLVILQGITFVLSWMILVGLLSFWFSSMIFGAASLLFILKLLVDFIFLKKTHQWLGYTGCFDKFIWTSFVYLCYIVLIGIYALFPNGYRWKGREV